MPLDDMQHEKLIDDINNIIAVLISLSEMAEMRPDMAQSVVESVKLLNHAAIAAANAIEALRKDKESK
jgi:hypothetical protein